MSKYKNNYCRFFGFSMDQDEFIPSEISGQRAVDIHHIFAKQMGGRKTFTHEGVAYDIDAIENLIALTREEHLDAHNPLNQGQDQIKYMLWDLHKKRMETHLRISSSNV